MVDRRLTLAGLVLTIGLLLAACSPPTPAGGVGGRGSGKIAALAGFYPLYEVIQRVGGDRVDVTNLVPAGAAPHDLELSLRELERLRLAQLLVYVGAEFQPGLGRALQAVQAPRLTVVDVTQGMRLLERSADDDADERPQPGGASPTALQQDPHVWLDPVLMKGIVANVRDALTRIDGPGRDAFSANASAYQAQLDALDAEFRFGLRECARRAFITSHAAFQYLANRYGLEQVPIGGLSPEAEPSARRLREVAAIARTYGARVIYFETLVDPRVAETIAREVGARTMVLNPIEGLTTAEQAQGKQYADIMRENLANLRAGLDCS